MVRMSTGGDSKQDYGTPKDFMKAVEKRFGPIVFDLAASPENAKAKDFFTIEDNSLEKDWLSISYPKLCKSGTYFRNILWLNPPYKNIGKWVKKAWEIYYKLDYDTHLLILVPASVGSNWFKNYVAGYADVHFLTGRLTFDGAEDPYPRDCMLLEYQGRGADIGFLDYEPSMGVWEWKNDINR